MLSRPHLPARITEVRYGSQTVQGVVTYEALLNADNADLSLRPGMTATADITVKKIENALLAPNAALRFTPLAVREQAAAGGGNLLSKLLPRPPGGGAKKGDDAGGREDASRSGRCTREIPSPLRYRRDRPTAR